MHEAIQTVARFRTVAFWEGISFLILLFVAMPLKYGLGVDMAVRVVGLAHGLLFIAYVATLGLPWSRLGPRLGFIAFIVAFVPGGTFWLDARMKPDSERRLP